MLEQLSKICDVGKSSRDKRQPKATKTSRDLFYISSSEKDYNEFPAKVQRHIGFNLRFAQNGETGDDTKTLSGFGNANIKEVVSDTANETFRAVYTVEFEKAVYVLHAFQKKSHKGIKTDKADIDLIKERLKAAEAHYKAKFPS